MPRGRPKKKLEEPPKAHGNRRCDPIKALRMHKRGIPQSVIADRLGVAQSTVSDSLKSIRELVLDPNELKEYRNKEIDLLDSAKLRFITAAADAERVKKASTLQLTTAFCQLTDKSQLLQGKATSNVALHTTIQAAQDRIRQVEELLSDVGAPPEPQDVDK